MVGRPHGQHSNSELIGFKMAKSNTGLLLGVGAAALLLMGGKKKKGGTSNAGKSVGLYDIPPGEVYPGNTPPPSTGGGGESESESEKWKPRQKGLKILGYSEVGAATGLADASTSTAIKLFQTDWNTLIGYLDSVGSPAVGNSPYTLADEDGAWGPMTQARYDKAMHEFGYPPVEVEDFSMSFNSFRDMVAELESRL